MKKLVILAALMTMSVSSWAAVGTVALNNFDSDKPVFAIGGAPVPVNQDYFVQLLGGPVGGTLGAVVPTGGGTGVLSFTDFAGYFDGGVGIVPGAAANGQASFELRAWKGAAGYDAANERGSVTWNQAVGSWDNTAQPPPPPSGAVLDIPSNLQIAIIPEPSTIALGLLGAAALLIRRRK